MNRIKKFGCFAIMFLLLSAITPTFSVNASAPKATSTIEPRADKIVTKYRYYNGVYQYRRWNETKGCWVDPAWINMT